MIDIIVLFVSLAINAFCFFVGRLTAENKHYEEFVEAKHDLGICENSLEFYKNAKSIEFSSIPSGSIPSGLTLKKI
jgi:hypothetical protein